MNDQNPFQTHLPSNTNLGLRTGSVHRVLMLVPPVPQTWTYLSLITCGISPRMKLNMRWCQQASSTRFNKDEWTRIVTGNKNEEVYGKKLVFPSRIKYLYFSRRLYDDIMKNRRKRLEQEYDEAMSLQKTIREKRRPRRKYRNSKSFPADTSLLHLSPYWFVSWGGDRTCITTINHG